MGCLSDRGQVHMTGVLHRTGNGLSPEIRTGVGRQPEELSPHVVPGHQDRGRCTCGQHEGDRRIDVAGCLPGGYPIQSVPTETYHVAKLRAIEIDHPDHLVQVLAHVERHGLDDVGGQVHIETAQQRIVSRGQRHGHLEEINSYLHHPHLFANRSENSSV